MWKNQTDARPCVCEFLSHVCVFTWIGVVGVPHSNDISEHDSCHARPNARDGGKGAQSQRQTADNLERPSRPTSNGTRSWKNAKKACADSSAAVVWDSVSDHGCAVVLVSSVQLLGPFYLSICICITAASTSCVSSCASCCLIECECDRDE